MLVLKGNRACSGLCGLDFARFAVEEVILASARGEGVGGKAQYAGAFVKGRGAEGALGRQAGIPVLDHPAEEGMGAGPGPAVAVAAGIGPCARPAGIGNLVGEVFEALRCGIGVLLASGDFDGALEVGEVVVDGGAGAVMVHGRRAVEDGLRRRGFGQDLDPLLGEGIGPVRVVALAGNEPCQQQQTIW